MDATETATRDVVDGQFDAYNDGDAEAFAEYFADDAVVAPLSGEEATAEGGAAIREQYAGLFDARPALHCEFRDRLTVGPFDVCHESITGMDEPMEALAVYEVRDGAIQRLWIGHV